MNLKNFSKIVVSVLLLAPSLSFAKALEVDPNHSSVLFEATHLKISKVPGKFGEFSGTLDLNEKDITKSKIDFTVQIASINTNVLQRDDHLRSPDFFDAKTFPKATFKTTSVKKTGKNIKLEGDLTIRDVTKKVTFDVKNMGKAHDAVMKTEKYVFIATGQINRKDFGVNYGTDDIVGDKVALWINLETMPKKADQPTPNQATPGQTKGGEVGK